MNSGISQERGLPLALFIVALATVMFEVLLTRIFSLTMWYHFAFMAISIAMFGLTVGALLVFLRPHWWPAETVTQGMGKAALFLSIAMTVVIFLHISLYLPSPAVDMVPMVVTFIGVAVPFVFSGIFVCLALTRFPARIGKLYAADLAGAAIGCLGVVVALKWLDGVGAVLACAALAASASLPLLRGWQRAAGLLVGIALAGTCVGAGVYYARNDLAAFEIHSIRGLSGFDYERWNSFSRIVVLKSGVTDSLGWSMSSAYKGSARIEPRWLQIDSIAGSQLVPFDGDLKTIEFLRWDLTNFAQILRPEGRIAVVGAGGGRDVLAARLFGQKRVVAVEINGDTMRVVNERFGDFTGHLDRHPGVSFVNDEARSYLTRQREKFDLVVLTFIDTFAATAAGAYTLTENPLYTVEGWKVFLDRLDDNGLLAVSRGISPELGRLVALGRAALLRTGAARPEQHMVLLTNPHVGAGSAWPMGLLLVRKTPFGIEELGQIDELAKAMNFEVDLKPGAAKSPLLLALATGSHSDEVTSGPANYAAPTDDQPFFFHMARPSTWLMLRGGGISPASGAAVVLATLLFTVTGMTLACIVLPLLLARTRLRRADGALFALFAAIGTGFMLIEVSMLQRLIVFLGHPTYSLSVILFVLLLTGGAGSHVSSRIPDERLRTYGIRILAALTAVLATAGFATVPLISHFGDASTPLRIAVSAGLLAPMGLLMGMIFPMGMRLAAASRAELAPWLWGVNGATSVLASVLAVVIAMAVGISASFWAGVGCYALALAAYAGAARSTARV
jgi:hypothetical protein